MKTDWDARAPAVGGAAPDPQLLDETGKPVELSSFDGALVVVFFPWPLDTAASRLVRDYRDSTMAIEREGARVVGISAAEPSALAFLRMELGVGFPMLSDADATATSLWGMSGKLGVFVLDRGHVVRQRAAAERAASGPILQFLRKGGASKGRPRSFLAKLAGHLGRLRGHLLPRRTATRAVR